MFPVKRLLREALSPRRVAPIALGMAITTFGLFNIHRRVDVTELVQAVRQSGRRFYAVCIALVTLAVVFVVFKVLLQLAYVPSGSMETTIPTK